MNGLHNFLIHLQMTFHLIQQIHQNQTIIFHHRLLIHHQINKYKHRHILLTILICSNIHNGCLGMNNLICKISLNKRKKTGVNDKTSPRQFLLLKSPEIERKEKRRKQKHICIVK